MKNKKEKNTLSILLIIIDVLALFTFFIVYGPFDTFRNWFIPTSMTTMTHRYFAHTLYDDETIDKTLDNNKVVEPDNGTDISKINLAPIVDTGEYESIYEEQILKKDNDNDLYKIVDLEGDGYKGYMIVVYDPSKLQLVFSQKYRKGGEYLSTMAKNNNAVVAINASGVSHAGNNRVTGTAIKDGKVFDTGNKINKGGGLIGFTKDNILMLTKDSPAKAIETGMDRAVEFGPFLIVNGVESKFKGNGGWGIANRTAIGQRQDGIVLLVVIDGRSATSKGISIVGLKDIFVKYKAYNAANLDGGGSSAMYANGKLLNNPVGYGYKGERYLPNAWMIIPESTQVKEN